MRRKISWNAALSDAKADRAVRSDVRCERLKTASASGHFVAWRGKSGRRYVFTVLPVASDRVVEPGDVVLRVRVEGGVYTVRSANIGRIPSAGDVADELHIHTLAGERGEALALIGDLKREGL